MFVSVCRRRNSDILPSLEDLLFYTVAEGEEKIPVHKFLTVSLSKLTGAIELARDQFPVLNTLHFILGT